LKRISFPVAISLSLTRQCNLNCGHCILTRHPPRKELNTFQFSSIIKQICVGKPFSVSITGGEPLLRRDFFKLVDLFKGSRIQIVLKTNGTLIDRRMAGRLSRSPIDSYLVSLDGASAEINDPIRGRGSFKKAVAGIRNLVLGNKVIVSCTLTKQNYQDLENIVILSKRMGCGGVKVNRLFLNGSALINSAAFRMGYDDLVALGNILKRIKEKFLDFAFGSAFAAMKNFEYGLRGAENITFPLKVEKCRVMANRCAIQPDGWVTPCDVLSDTRIGNLKERSFQDIWSSKKIRDAACEVKLDKKDMSDCASCRFIYWCLQYLPCHSANKKWKGKILGGLYCLRPN
jgi:mycofactocin biosynthetic radical S-adenosylmethionine protein MftC